MKFSILRFSVSGGGAEDEDGACNNRWTHSVDPQLQVNLDGAELRVENGARLLMLADLQQMEWHMYQKNQSLLIVPAAKGNQRAQLKFRFMGDLQRVLQYLSSPKFHRNIHLHSNQQHGGRQPGQTMINDSSSINSPPFLNSQQFGSTISTVPQRSAHGDHTSPHVLFQMQPPQSSQTIQVPIKTPQFPPPSQQWQQQQYQKVHAGNLQSLMDVTAQFTQPQQTINSSSPSGPQQSGANFNDATQQLPIVALSEEVEAGRNDEALLERQIRRILADPEFPGYLRRIHSLLTRNDSL